MKTTTLPNIIRIFLCALAGIFTTAGLRAQEDARPVVDDSKVVASKPAANNLPTLFLVGDSTLNSNMPLRGWAQEIGVFFDPAKINVVNRAIGGRSSRTFIGEGRWDKVLAEMKAGDFVMVQFGHNDVGPLDAAGKFRGSIKGEGEDTQSVAKPDGTTEIVHSFGWYMRKYCTDAKAKGVSVILCSMIPHKGWEGAKVKRGEKDSFVKWTANAAKAGGAQFIDLNAIIAKGYEQLGQQKVESLFADKGTHTSVEGAKYNAAAVISGLKSLEPDPLAKYFSAAAAPIQAAR
jgi:lysophospholipase L1-like esterase